MGDDYVKNEKFCQDSKLNEAIATLFSEHDCKKVVSLCCLVINEMKMFLHSEKNDQSILSSDMEKVENCFLHVFFKHWRASSVFLMVTEALTLLITIDEAVKIRTANKGILLYIDEVLHHRWKEEKQSLVIKCAYDLAIAVTENSPATLKYLLETNIIPFFVDSLHIYESNKDIVTCCLHQMSIIMNYETDDEQILQLKKRCSNNLLRISDEEIPMAKSVLNAMIRFPNSLDLQLHGLKCLKVFTTLDGGMEAVYGNGGMDLACIALLLYIQNDCVFMESLAVITNILMAVERYDIVIKESIFFNAIAMAIENSTKNLHRICTICDCLLAFLLVGDNLGKNLLEKEIPLKLFQTLKNISACPEPVLAEYHRHVVYKLAQCLYLIVSNADDDIRDGILYSACKNGDVDLALFSVFLGANINLAFNKNLKPLAIACENQDEIMVKQLLTIMATFHHVRLLPCRIDEVQSSLHISIQKRNDHITAALLWYLLNRDLNGIAEWSNCNLSRLKSDWLEMAFSSQSSRKRIDKCEYICMKAIQQFRSYDLGITVLQSSLQIQDGNNNSFEIPQLLKNKLIQFKCTFDDKRCPLQHIQSSVENSANVDNVLGNSSDASKESGKDQFELSNMYKCRRCNGYVAFREILRIDFDEETNLEESIDENSIENCTCPVVFPPVHVSSVEVTEIQLSQNDISSLNSFAHLSPSTKESLSSTVKRINLFSNHITEVPSQVAQIFGNLVELNLSRNQLISFPFDVLRFCPKLDVLDLSDNLLQTGTSLSESPNLNLGRTRSDSLPSQFQHNLKILKMSKNAFHFFPNWILKIFTNLEHLDISKNTISTFVSKDTLNEFAKESTNLLSCLKHLILSQNNMQCFCIYLLHFAPNLKHLDLSKNRISEIEFCDEDILLKPKLSFVDLSGNQLGDFPQFVCMLPCLKVLLLNNNRIRETPAPSIAWKSRFLQRLDLSENRLVDIADLTALLVDNWPSTLKVLNLAHNAIEALAPSLGKLRALEVLEINNNNLRELPDELGYLSKLKSFFLHDNEPSLEETISKGNAQEIRQFLYARLKQSVPQDHVKLILVGDPNAGKTTLLKSLQATKRIRTISKSSPSLATIGVNVVKVILKQGKRQLQLSVWDFAGQEDFYATHPCFISEHAIYVALYDASKGSEQLETLKPWLTAIHARAKHCPVIIIGTHADEMRNKSLESKSLKQKLEEMSQSRWFPQGVLCAGIKNLNLFDVRETSGSSARLRNLIMDAIFEAKIQERPLVGNMVPYSYVQLSELLEQEAEKRSDFPVITFKDLVDLLHHNDSALFESRSELMMALKYLHQTGFLLHFDDPRSRLQDYFFIRPAWLCKLLAQVVTLSEDNSYKISYIDKDGILSKTNFVNHFSTVKFEDYSIHQDFFPQLFRILKNFEILLSQGNDSYLVPARLPVDKPNIDLPVREVPDKLIRYFSLVYTPMGLWSRLLARLLAFGNKLLSGFEANNAKYTYSPPQKWREGVYFKWENTGMSPEPFALIQSGSEEYDNARRISTGISSSSTTVHFSTKGFLNNPSSERKKRERGMEIIVPRTQAGVILLARIVDHVTSLVEEWYPGLLNPDGKGKSLFQQYAPCSVCYNDLRVSEVHSFCIDDLAESILSDGFSLSSTQTHLYDTRMGNSGELLVYCGDRNTPNHKDTPVRLKFLAPDINLDDYEQSLRLDPKLLTFEPTSRHILGKGGFGIVHKAIYDNQDVAIKTFSVYRDGCEMAYKKLRTELNVLAQHQHPSIISLKGFIPPASSTPDLPLPLLALEYARLGSLGKLLSKMTKLSSRQRESALPLTIRHRIAYEVAEGLCFLHCQNIVYRDLKPDNILLMSLDPSSHIIAKITDYGISVHASPAGTPGTLGSPGYSAPEVVSLRVQGKARLDLYPYSMNCDMYSYGLVLHEIAVGRSPWVDYVCEERHSGLASGNTEHNPDKIVLEGYKPSPILTYEGALAWPYADELITNCLNRNPEQRPTPCDVVSLLSSVQSCCLRSFVLVSSDPVFPKTYKDSNSDKNSMLSCTSCKGIDVSSSLTNRNGSPIVNTFYSTASNLGESDEKQCNIVKMSVDMEKDRVQEDDDWLLLGSEFTISCMLQAPTVVMNRKLERKQQPLRTRSLKIATDANPVIVAGTLQGHLLIIQSRNVIEKKRFSSPVTALHFHRTQEKKLSPNATEGYVVVGFEDCSLVLYTLDQIVNAYNKNPLFTIKLSDDIAISEPVQALDSIGSTLYVVCGNKIAFFSLGDSGGPSMQQCPIETLDRIQCFAVGNTHFYTSYFGRDKVQIWQRKGFSQKVLDITTALIQKFESLKSFSLAVMSIFLDKHHSALWVGTSGGHVIVYSERSYEVLIVMHRHSGPVEHIFVLPDSDSESERIACLGKGFRPVTMDINWSEKDSFSPSFSAHVDDSSFYLTFWDADLPRQVPALASVLESRKNLMNNY